MPGRVRILLFGTGHGLKGWQEDHRWDVVAVSSDPGFTPRPSVVIGSVQSGWARNLGGREMWVSLGGTCHQPIATGTICTFRTTFELEGRQPDTATIRGRVFAVGHATAVRLNGRSVPGFDGEKYVWEGGNVPRPLLIQSGFVAGTNVLEIDVASGKQLPSAIPLSTLGLRVELDGSVQPKP
jgi:hypothetical protein